jgi:predicted transcriptional regulator
MVARCESIGKYVMPVFRSLVAKELIYKYNLTQVEAAQRLGTTQAAISQYINSKRAYKGTEQFVDIMPKIRKIAVETARRLATNEVNTEVIAMDFCTLCTSINAPDSEGQAEDYII